MATRFFPLEDAPGSVDIPSRCPVCGRRVEAAEARWTEEHEGRRFAFCNATCRTRFRAEPSAFWPKSREARSRFGIGGGR